MGDATGFVRPKSPAPPALPTDKAIRNRLTATAANPLFLFCILIGYRQSREKEYLRVLEELEAQYTASQYELVFTALDGRARTAREHALLGISLLRLSRFHDAELPLTKASVLGDPEAQVELGNLLRVLGRFREACAHFESVFTHLSGELQMRCLRWWGVAEFQAGEIEAGLKRCERAWYGYMAMGEDQLTAKVTQSLAQMHVWFGDYPRAKQLFMEAIRNLSNEPDPLARLSALTGLLDLQIETGDFDQAHNTITEARQALNFTASLRPRVMLLTSEAELLRLSGNYAGYLQALQELLKLVDDFSEHTVRVWVTSRLSEHYSQTGQHGKALEILLGYGGSYADWPPELIATHGVLAYRRGDASGAMADLDRAVRMYRERGRKPEQIRALLHLAGAAFRADHRSTAASALKEALDEMLRLKHLVYFKPDLEDLSELLHYAILEPELAPYLEPVLDNLSNLAGAPRLPEDGAMRLQVTTLGRIAVYKDGVPVEFAMRGSPLLLVYLTLRPGRTRAEIQLDLYPERDAVTGGNYVRKAMQELREKLGRDAVVFEGPHNAPWYHVGRFVHVDLDVQHFHDALGRGDVARALALYRGEFMPGVEEGEWVRETRDEARLALTFELRTQIARYKSQGDYRRVILLANQLLRADPDDLEVLEERVDAAKIVASPHELAKYVAALNRHKYN